MHHCRPRLASWVSSAGVAGNLHFTTRILYISHVSVPDSRLFHFRVVYCYGLGVCSSSGHRAYVVWWYGTRTTHRNHAPAIVGRGELTLRREGTLFIAPLSIFVVELSAFCSVLTTRNLNQYSTVEHLEVTGWAATSVVPSRQFPGLTTLTSVLHPRRHLVTSVVLRSM